MEKNCKIINCDDEANLFFFTLFFNSFGNVPLNLGMDQAYLNVSSSYPEFLEVHGISANCYKVSKYHLL